MDDPVSMLMARAIMKARESVAAGGFPAGAIVVLDGKIIGEGISIGHLLNDPTSHGEMAAIRDACRNIETANLKGGVLYSSMQPCVMCLGAAMWGSISKVFYACAKNRVSDEYYGGHYGTQEINSTFTKPLEFIHCKDFEQESLEIVKQWEATLA